jgi:hypothetical protein
MGQCLDGQTVVVRSDIETLISKSIIYYSVGREGRQNKFVRFPKVVVVEEAIEVLEDGI